MAPVVVVSLWDEPQRPERAVIAEEPLAAAHDDRVDHQPELVDEVMLDQRLDQLGVADRQQVMFRGSAMTCSSSDAFGQWAANTS